MTVINISVESYALQHFAIYECLRVDRSRMNIVK